MTRPLKGVEPPPHWPGRVRVPCCTVMPSWSRVARVTASVVEARVRVNEVTLPVMVGPGATVMFASRVVFRPGGWTTSVACMVVLPPRRSVWNWVGAPSRAKPCTSWKAYVAPPAGVKTPVLPFTLRLPVKRERSPCSTIMAARLSIGFTRISVPWPLMVFVL